jgi:CubicO group peptidase (beta-lactamase class C family)
MQVWQNKKMLSTRPLRTLALVGALILAAVTASALRGAQGPAAPAGWDAFTQQFDSLVVRDQIVGASVLVLQDGNVLAHHEHGLADRAAGKPVTERTLFHYGSITKTLTAIAIMQLRDRGRLTLDDHVTQYIPELRQVHNPYGSMDAITIRMLLSHSSGFPGIEWRNSTTTVPVAGYAKQVEQTLSTARLKHAPGEMAVYCDDGFAMLGWL